MRFSKAPLFDFHFWGALGREKGKKMNKKKYQAKFPMARIKKIMQKDEEVGKIALMTPVVMSKAVEMFMASLVQAACDQVAQSSARRILPSHLKVAIHTIDSFDFLRDLVANVPMNAAAVSDSERELTGSAKKKKIAV